MSKNYSEILNKMEKKRYSYYLPKIEINVFVMLFLLPFIQLFIFVSFPTPMLQNGVPNNMGSIPFHIFHFMEPWVE